MHLSSSLHWCARCRDTWLEARKSNPLAFFVEDADSLKPKQMQIFLNICVLDVSPCGKRTIFLSFFPIEFNVVSFGRGVTLNLARCGWG
eukprot:c42657_g1_i1 orf=2-265(-)